MSQPALFEARGRFVLWGRETSRHRWRVVGSADTGPEALARMDGSGIRGGDWILRDDGTDPNHKEGGGGEDEAAP